MVGYTPKGMQLAHDTLVTVLRISVGLWIEKLLCCDCRCKFHSLWIIFPALMQIKMTEKGGYFLNPRMGSDLLLAAAGEMVWNEKSHLHKFIVDVGNANYIPDICRPVDISLQIIYGTWCKRAILPQHSQQWKHITRAWR